jgi:hypothetical protein
MGDASRCVLNVFPVPPLQHGEKTAWWGDPEPACSVAPPLQHGEYHGGGEMRPEPMQPRGPSLQQKSPERGKAPIAH